MTDLSTVVTDPTDDTCPGCGDTTGVQPQPAPSTVEPWTCQACGLCWVTTVVNPSLRVALSIVGLLPTPQLVQRAPRPSGSTTEWLGWWCGCRRMMPSFPGHN